MPSYMTYMKTLESAWHVIGVWQPGSPVELGDFGDKRVMPWTKRGSIWDFISDESLRGSDVNSKLQQNFGSLNEVNAGAQIDSLEINFHDKNAVFLRADECEIRQFNKVNSIAKVLRSSHQWDPSWWFVEKLCVAKSFVVIVAEEKKGRLKVQAKNSKVLQLFQSGYIQAKTDISLSGCEHSFFYGPEGPIHMSLCRPKPQTWFRANSPQFGYKNSSKNDDEVETLSASKYLKSL